MKPNVFVFDCSYSPFNTRPFTVIERLQAVHIVVDDINSKTRDLSISDYEPSLDIFATPIEKLTKDFEKEYTRYHVDEIVVAAIVPTV